MIEDDENVIKWTGDVATGRSVSRAMVCADSGLFRGLPELVATEIRDRRKRAGMTQAQLASKVGVGHETISKWECGKTMPSNRNLAALEDADAEA